MRFRIASSEPAPDSYVREVTLVPVDTERMHGALRVKVAAPSTLGILEYTPGTEYELTVTEVRERPCP